MMQLPGLNLQQLLTLDIYAPFHFHGVFMESKLRHQDFHGISMRFSCY